MGKRMDAAVAFGVAFIAMLVVALAQGEKSFYYDAAVYWELGGSFVRDGTFSLLNFDSPLRGYLLPLINLGLAEIATGLEWSASTLAKIFNAAVFAVVSTVLAPALATLAWPERRWNLWRRLGVAALLLMFWRGYLNFPLSDFPALAAVLLALVAAGRSTQPAWMLVAGIASAVAINMRPAYVLLIPVVLSLVALDWWNERGTRAPGARRLLGVGLLVCGFVAISLPQSLATERHHDSWSFVPGATAGLSTLQFTEGLRIQRYETFIGVGQPGPRMLYRDPAGERILVQDDDQTIVDAREYAGVVASHPLDMAGVFLRHVVNGLDQRYETPYIESIDTGSQRWLRLLGFLLVFLALTRVIWPAARRSLGRARWRYPLALVVCGLPSIASAVETRFLLPAYLAAYLLVLAPGWPNPFASTRPLATRARTAAVLLTAFAVYLAVVLHIVGNATDNLQIA
jgi:hypothetical protein